MNMTRDIPDFSNSVSSNANRTLTNGRRCRLLLRRRRNRSRVAIKERILVVLPRQNQLFGGTSSRVGLRASSRTSLRCPLSRFRHEYSDFSRQHFAEVVKRNICEKVPFHYHLVHQIQRRTRGRFVHFRLGRSEPSVSRVAANSATTGAKVLQPWLSQRLQSSWLRNSRKCRVWRVCSALRALRCPTSSPSCEHPSE